MVQIALSTNYSCSTQKYFLHKFHGPGVKYKVGICRITGWVCWFNGPFPAGNPDLRISKLGICNYLENRNDSGRWGLL
jgi:hypothetical protein